MANSQSSIPVAVLKSLGAGIVFCGEGFWKWPVLSAIAILFYSCGVGAMSLHQYPLATALYFVAVALLAWRAVAHARTHEKKAGVITVILIIGAIIFGLSTLWLVHTYDTQTAQPHAVIRLGAWISTGMSVLWAIPWRWVIPTAVISIVLATIVNVIRDRHRKTSICPNKQLHVIAEDDKEKLHQLVKIYGVNCQTEIDQDGAPPFINFTFAILNMALQQVAILDEIEGSIRFHKDGFNANAVGIALRRPPTIESNFARKCLFRGQHQFTIRQDLTLEEAAYISSGSKDSLFRFAALTITIQAETLSRARLNTDLHVKTNGRYWAEPSEYVFAGHDVRLTHQELLQRIDALPPDERAIAHEAAMKIHGANLYRNYTPSVAASVSSSVAQQPPDLTFETDPKQMRVHLGAGTAVRSIRLSVRLRCFNASDNPQGVKDLHVSLHKESNGNIETLKPKEDARIAPHKGVLDMDNWIVTDPITPFYWFEFYLEVSTEQALQLSHDYFLRLTMIAVGQDAMSIDLYVDDWHRATSNGSTITLRH